MIEALSDYKVILPVVVGWGDMDAFAHVNNTVYFRYFEHARIAYFERALVVPSSEGTAQATVAVPTGVGPILASASCRFKAPVRYPDRVQVGIRVSELADDRFTMRYAIYSERLARIAAEGDGVIVAFDYGTGKKASVPELWRERIAELEGWR
ncbi:MAG: acyl-CoA thioesterase [Deltaproteobacteria bacterium]|nr:acyl-CoA thioesterase [Deltaproteobacteria bacterium]